VYCSFIAQFKFVQVDPARLQNVKFGTFLAITRENDQLVVTTTTDEGKISEFNIHEVESEVSLESVAFSGRYIGVDDDCKVKVESDGASVNARFKMTVIPVEILASCNIL
jgi:hypothetical protein